ncbi:unnamed protein product [Urochloa decumbens]|uniref:tRNA uridine(34) hydroxylase N-terminal domain-containing protein n=1 Tax=Urochloa decumbens TaxID=240449 RepID=A0ABC8VKV4_9POAL
MLPSPLLAAAFSKTAAAAFSNTAAAATATRRAATAAASIAAHRLLLPVRTPIHNPSAPSSLIPRRHFGHMPLEERTAPLAPLPPLGRNIAVAVGEGGVDGEGPALVVVSFYRFADFPDHAAFRRPLKELCEELRVSGGIILAPEGINGSICGTPAAVDKVLNFIQEDNRLNGLRMIQSPLTPEDEAIHHGHTSQSPVGAGDDAPFRWDHVRVKLKKEIVTFGDPGVMPTKMVGKYVKPKDWNALISDPDTESSRERLIHVQTHSESFLLGLTISSNWLNLTPRSQEQIMIMEQVNQHKASMPANLNSYHELLCTALVVSDVRRHLAFFLARALKRFIIWKVGF